MEDFSHLQAQKLITGLRSILRARHEYRTPGHTGPSRPAYRRFSLLNCKLAPLRLPLRGIKS